MTAAVTAGWQCPVLDTENPASMSTYSLPSASQTSAPRPRTMAGGQSNSAKPTWPVQLVPDMLAQDVLAGRPVTGARHALQQLLWARVHPFALAEQPAIERPLVQLTLP